ncbi:hypothetical protein I302_100193 [Kwoniella bestiolae CBS 10118]|uniref:Carboxylic ester hydrolase n=1 Tax=Kwoniella bestiolae CBS 10118 TaxID=1296100 RepID=A0A1B9G4G0_9TREE|nr:hypothetical protein I302_03568 [Kwoniella bestiolae CBS 10118]OCF25892.1 hypothetical protein I302_03568 [Kwoniella bestiolae CBS 10118]
MKWTILLPLLPLVLSAPAPAPQNNDPASTSAAQNATATATATGSSSTSTGSSPSNTTSNNPSVTIYPDTSNGTPIKITGVNVAEYGQDLYLGVPYAQPPVGDLRFSPPQSYIYNFSVTAQKQPPACLQSPNGLAGTQSEDCLYLNVYAPQGSNATSAYLPVMVWIYGGSFTSGSIDLYNATALQAYASKTGKPFIYVALNYRLGTFGWPSGSGFAENGAANLGLKDIRKGLEWVQENIWAFGGNPDQVTVFGESAGAIATSLLYLDENINTFKSAIMESGAQSTTPIGPTGSTWEDAYQYLLQVTNCSSTPASSANATAATPSSAANTTATTSSTNATSTGYATSSDSTSKLTGFECLKALPADALLKGQLTVKSNLLFAGFIYGPSIDGDLIPDSPHTLLSQGRFAKKPFISGNNKDEGTSFVPSFVNSTQTGMQLLAIFSPVDPDNSTVAQLYSLYSPEPSAGSPFDTGNQTFGFSPAHKQIAAILGDAQFQAPRRYFLEQANSHGLDQTWSYQFEQYTPGQPAARGVYHASEIPYVYGLSVPGANLTSIGFGNNYTVGDQQLSYQMVDYWLNFAYYSNPNGQSNSNATVWPTYSNDKNILRLKSDNITVFTDNYRQAQMDFFNGNPTEFNYKRSIAGVQRG